MGRCKLSTGKYALEEALPVADGWREVSYEQWRDNSVVDLSRGQASLNVNGVYRWFLLFEPLPTEPGFYLDKDGRPWEWDGFDWDCLYDWPGPVHEYAPLRRLLPEEPVK